MSTDTGRSIPARVLKAHSLEAMASVPANVRRLPSAAAAPVAQSCRKGRHGPGVVSLASRPAPKPASTEPASWLDLVPPALGQSLEAQESALIDAAIAALMRRLSAQRPEHDLKTPEQVKRLAYLRLAHLDREHFAVAFMDAQLRLIAFEEMFAGTLSEVAVYPREIARRALACNAAAVFLAHNHPSGDLTPSVADDLLTRRVRYALESLNVRLIDHVIASRQGVTSFAERGLL